MATGGSRAGQLSVAIANAVIDPGIDDPDALLARFFAQTGWARAVREAGARVTVAQRFARDLVVRRDGVDYHFVADSGGPRTGAWFWGPRLARDIAAREPDVVHVQGMVFPLLVRNLRVTLAPPGAIVVQDHGGIHERSPGFARWPWRMFHAAGLRAADAAMFTARALAAPWQQAGILTGDQPIHEVAESSTDLHEWAPATAPAPTPRLPGRPALLWVGRLDDNKDPLTVLAGFERALAALPDAALTFVYGSDSLLPALRSRAAASPALRDRVHFRGAVERAALAPIYRGADMFVLASHHEGSSFALIEALAFGLTPVVTDIAALRALTGGGRLGALFPPGDAGALARALVEAAGGDLAARRAAVRAHFARELAWPAIGRKAVAAYAAVVAARRATRR